MNVWMDVCMLYGNSILILITSRLKIKELCHKSINPSLHRSKHPSDSQPMPVFILPTVLFLDPSFHLSGTIT